MLSFVAMHFCEVLSAPKPLIGPIRDVAVLVYLSTWLSSNEYRDRHGELGAMRVSVSVRVIIGLHSYAIHHCIYASNC
jgi:hypothetical protein